MYNYHPLPFSLHGGVRFLLDLVKDFLEGVDQLFSWWIWLFVGFVRKYILVDFTCAFDLQLEIFLY